MALSTEVVARKYLDVSAGTAISVDVPVFEASDVYVYYGKASLIALQGTDYSLTLAEDFETITVTPLQSLIDKIDALISVDATETNYITVRRTLDYETEATPDGVRYTPFTSKEFDRNAMRDQQLAENMKRALTFPPSELGEDIGGSVVNVEPGQFIRRDDDGRGFSGAALELEVTEVDAWFQNRDVTAATQAALLTDGSVVSLNGLTYRVDSSATGAGSVTEDLGVDGLVHFGEFNLRHVGAACNGVTDDTAAWLRAKSYILQLNSNPTWSNEATLSDWTGDRHYIPNGIDMFGLGRIWIKGEIITDGSDEIKFGLNSVLGEPTLHQFGDLRNGKFVAQGLMNGRVVLGNAPELIVRADTTTTDRKSCSYTSFYMGSVPIITLIGISGPNGSPYINSNNFYGQRGATLNIQGDYPHNHNMFYGFCFENSTFNFSVGYSNHVKDCRLEGTCVYNASAGTFDNWVFRTYNQFADSYFRQLGATLTTVNNLGGDQGVVDEGDKYYSMETIYAVTPDSANYDAKTFERGVSALTCRANYNVFFDSGLIEVKNPFALMIETDQAFWQPFLYAYDGNGNLITTETDVTGVIPALSWDAANSRFKFGASMGDGAVISVYPDLANGVKFVRYTVGTGLVSGSAFRHFKLKKIERSSSSTVIPIAKPKPKGFHFYGTGVAPVPTAGTWQTGDIVENTNPQELGSSPNKYFTARWHRLTDGSGNVLNTDWRAERVLTGN